MLNHFEIKSVAKPERGLLEVFSRDFIKVSVKGSEFSAQAKATFLGGGDGLDKYWADIASNRRGLSGEKAWRSLEGDLRFSATSDRTGHVTLKVNLEHGAPWIWQTHTILTIEAGQLDGIAVHAYTFACSLGAMA